MGLINSHIQITKSLLENFSHKTKEGKKAYFLDLSDKKIKEEKIRLLGTEFGYYSEQVEEFLNKEIENKIGDIAKIFRTFSKGKSQQLKITKEQQEHIKLFYRFSLIRSNLVIKEANKASVSSAIFGEIRTNDIIPFINNDKLSDPFEGYFATILVNKSNVEFVIPRNCIYSAVVKNKKTKYILPINPYVAFILVHISELENYLRDGIYHYPQILEGEITLRLNKRALFDEMVFNNKFIVANRRNELEVLQKYLLEENDFAHIL